MSTSTSWEAFEERIAAAASLSDIEAIDHELFGRKAGAMTEALKGLKDIPNEEKKAAAQELNMWKKKFGEMLDEKKSELGGGSSTWKLF